MVTSTAVRHEVSAESAIQPYQALFPIGILFALSGVVVWTLHGLGLIPYPGLYHANWMIGGFLLSFSAGFLMTALPRFTGAQACSNTELFLSVSLACAQVVHIAFTAALFVFLAAFALRRFSHRRYSPPPHFIFVGLGLALGVVGSVGLTLHALELVPSVPYVTLRIYFLQGVLLCFIVGIGARLVRVLLGYEPSPLVQLTMPGQKPRRATMFPSETRFQTYGSFALMAIGFALELVNGGEAIGRILRAIATSWIALSAWKLHRRPPRRGALVWGLYLACWCIALGTWAYALFPGWEVHSGHLLYVGGFATLAVMVASRVTLSHGGYPLAGEIRSVALRTTWILLFLSMITRVIAPLTQSYLQHLAYASVLGTIALATWGIWMFRRIKPSAE